MALASQGSFAKVLASAFSGTIPPGSAPLALFPPASAPPTRPSAELDGLACRLPHNSSTKRSDIETLVGRFGIAQEAKAKEKLKNWSNVTSL